MLELDHIDGVPAGVAALLRDLLEGIVSVLDGAIEGIVLYGSLAAGGFDAGKSDVDLLVAVAEGVDDAALESLRAMHARLASERPEWADRVDAVYVSAAALARLEAREAPMVVISPGEPLHRARTDPGWVMNWHVAREQGIALLGPPARELIAATTHADFVAAIRFHMRWMLAKAEASDSPALRAYAVVTACRALHACVAGAQASKEDAARWAERRYPDWSAPVRAARSWRERPSAEAAPIDGDLEFLRFAVAETHRSERPRS